MRRLGGDDLAKAAQLRRSRKCSLAFLGQREDRLNDLLARLRFARTPGVSLALDVHDRQLLDDVLVLALQALELRRLET